MGQQIQFPLSHRGSDSLELYLEHLPAFTHRSKKMECGKLIAELLADGQYDATPGGISEVVKKMKEALDEKYPFQILQ